MAGGKGVGAGRWGENGQRRRVGQGLAGPCGDPGFCSPCGRKGWLWAGQWDPVRALQVPLAVRARGSWVPQGWSDGLCPTRDGDNLARGGHGGRGGRRRSRFGGGADTVAAGLGLGWGERGLEDDSPAWGLGNMVEEACALRGGSGCVCESGVQGIKVGEVGGVGQARGESTAAKGGVTAPRGREGRAWPQGQ